MNIYCPKCGKTFETNHQENKIFPGMILPTCPTCETVFSLAFEIVEELGDGGQMDDRQKELDEAEKDPYQLGLDAPQAQGFERETPLLPVSYRGDQLRRGS